MCNANGNECREYGRDCDYNIVTVTNTMKTMVGTRNDDDVEYNEVDSM